jgi:hypothetical protein
MPLPCIFIPEETEKLVQRIQTLTPNSKAQWGEMTIAQIGFMMKWMMKNFFKSSMVNEKPYARNIKTASVFKLMGEKQFQREQERLIALVRAAHAMGEGYYHGLPHYALGPLSSEEWNNLLYKHLDHHLRQFGA